MLIHENGWFSFNSLPQAGISAAWLAGIIVFALIGRTLKRK
jgi:hypothetical protein